jgi:hypothetical protein
MKTAGVIKTGRVPQGSPKRTWAENEGQSPTIAFVMVMEHACNRANHPHLMKVFCVECYEQWWGYTPPSFSSQVRLG